MPEHLIEGLQRFRRDTFPAFREHYRRLVEHGQKPTALFIGCSDSRVVPDLLMGTEPGQLFIIRNMGAFVPPYDPEQGYHGTSATIEYAVLALQVTDIVVCGHSHCGAVRAIYDPPSRQTPHIQRWLDLGRGARGPGIGAGTRSSRRPSATHRAAGRGPPAGAAPGLPAGAGRASTPAPWSSTAGTTSSRRARSWPSTWSRKRSFR
jgi:carbonic anhydrase